MLLLNPGPVTLTERVRRSLLQPDLCHRESEFYDLQDEARSRLLGVHGIDSSRWAPVLITGSGTAAVESMIAGLIPETGRVLVIDNGVYGERIAQICSNYRLQHDRLTGSWMDAPRIDEIEALLRDGNQTDRFTHLALVHHETTTGRLNDLAPIAALCRTHGVQMLVDAVSSFGAEAIDFDDEALAAVAGTANKCLHGVPGASFVIARRSALAGAVRRSVYLDLGRLALLQDQRDTPFTPAVHVYYALVEALREHAEAGGRAGRYARYQAYSRQVRSGLASLGIAPLLNDSETSVVLSAFHLPVGYRYPELHDTLKAAGFVIYAGQSRLAETLFRISTMGDLAPAHITHLVSCFAGLKKK